MSQIRVSNPVLVGYQDKDAFIEQLPNSDICVSYISQGTFDTAIFKREDFVYINDTSREIKRALYEDLYQPNMPLIQYNGILKNLYSGQKILFYPDGNIKFRYYLRNGQLRENGKWWGPYGNLKVSQDLKYGYKTNHSEYYEGSMIPKRIKLYNYSEDYEINYYPSGVLKSKNDWKNSVFRTWDSLGQMTYQNDRNSIRYWEDMKLMTQEFYDTAGFYSLMIHYNKQGQPEKQVGKRRIPNHRTVQITTYYSDFESVSETDSLFEDETLEETTEVFEKFCPYEYPEPYGGEAALVQLIRAEIDKLKLTRSKSGIYTVLIDIGADGETKDVIVTSTAPKSESISKQLVQVLTQQTWKPLKLDCQGFIRSKVQLTIGVE
ncbi:MAG: hypothetical protein COA58_02595 [Bacteroidetes bacterium]|nr:MAG: hypothetical protein COA58_02595 [Bacteroidota bacterium]